MIGIVDTEESYQLLKLLKQHHRPLTDLISEFLSTFHQSLHFRLCTSIYLILEDNFLLTAPERLVAFTLLHQTYAAQSSSSNPFIRFIINAACNDSAETSERFFLLQLLRSSESSNIKEFLKQSAADYVKGFDPSGQTFPPVDQLEQQYCNNAHAHPYKCLFKDMPVKNVVSDPDVPSSCNINSREFDLQPGIQPKIGSGDKDETVAGLLSTLTLEGLGPQWIRPRPPRLPIQDGELVWLVPDNNHELLWDSGMCADTSRGAAIRDLIAKANKSPLVPAQQEVL